MKNFNDAKRDYINDHLSKDLVSPKIRLNALENIENTIKSHNPDLLKNDNLYRQFDKESFKEQYFIWKGNSLSGAEKSVIVGLFKFSK